MPHPLLIINQSDYFIQFVDINSDMWQQTVQIQISWLKKWSQLIWIYTVCKGSAYLGSAGPELSYKNAWIIEELVFVSLIHTDLSVKGFVKI